MNTHEIIDWVAAKYTLETRSVDPLSGACLYNSTNSKQCAFAAMCENPKDLIESKPAIYQLEKGIAILKPGYDGHPWYFYVIVQRLHDGDRYWNDKGLSDDGREYVAWIKDNFPVDN